LLPAGATLAGRDLHPLKNRAFPRRTLTSSSPVTGLFATVTSQIISAKLSASVGAPGPHDFAVRLSYARQS